MVSELELYKEECKELFIGKVRKTYVQCNCEMGVSLMKKIEPEDLHGLNDIYRDLTELVGLENMQKIYNQYNGFQISFPKKLYHKEYVREVVERDYDGSNTQELARRYGYTERWIRTIATETAKEGTEV